MRPSQNLPLPPRIYPIFQQRYVTLPESTPPFQNIPPPPQNIPLLSTTIILCDAPIIYPSPLPPEYTPLFNNYYIMRRSWNPLLPPRIYPSSSNYVRDFQNLPFLREYTPLFYDNCMQHSQNLPLPPRIYPSPLFYNYMLYYKNIPSVTEYAPFFRTTCMWERIYHSLPELKNNLGGRGIFWEGLIIF